jgi:hypothetical protein
MKRIIFACLFYILSITFAFSQEAKEYFTCGNFLKRIEYNSTGSVTHYNIKSKSDIEKLFFGDFNALIEFCYEPSNQTNPCIPSGFRIIRDSLNSSYVLEMKHITNYREAAEETLKEVNKDQMSQLIDIPARLLDSLPRDVFNKIYECNRKISNRSVFYSKYYEELPEHFKVEKKSIPIGNQFAENLYKRMVSFIDNFKAKGIPPFSFDGYSVSFRTVVADEVWSLKIHMPKGNASTIADFCMKIIKDVNEDKLEESILLDFKDF